MRGNRRRAARGAVVTTAVATVVGLIATLATPAAAQHIGLRGEPATARFGIDRGAVVARLLQATGEPPTQSPFLCTTLYNGLGQPLVDNQERRGTPVYPPTDTGAPDHSQDPIGWSERCQAPETVEYRYRATDGSTRVLAPGLTDLPDDVAYLPVSGMVGTDQLDTGGATEIPYILRLQRGTLPQNRFLYSIAMLAPFEEYLGETDGYSTDHWNGRLLFSFGGGVGIGHSQGDLSTGAATMHEAMRLGHAVVYSSGNRTSTHYNLLLGGRTAVETKDTFVAQHGAPVYTIGIGGSGGGIQQYVYAQNHPDLLDAGIPQYSYPDMVSQTIHIGDCELLEHYMDVLDADNPRWQDWNNRRILQGLNTIEGFTSSWQARTGDTGSSECIEGWRGATPLAMNPNFGLATRMDSVFEPYIGEILGKATDGNPDTHPYPEDFPDLGRLLRTHEDRDSWVDWTHWDDAIEVYGTDPATGYARVPWDNVGVQYGLRSVADGTLTPEEFLDLNAKVGSWKEQDQMTAETCGMVGAMAGAELALFGGLIGLCVGSELDQYSSDQMSYSTDAAAPAPRRTADVDAITAAFESGHVFDGHLPRQIPMIDSRHYLEHELDMHNAQQSFGVRERIRRTQGNIDNHLIWFLDARPTENAAATSQLHDDAFRLLDEWVLNMQADPTAPVGHARPAAAVDRCFDTDGTQIAAGDDVWSGANELVLTGEGDWTGSAPASVDGVPVGSCSAHFPLHSTSRIVAGGPITGDVFKCRTKPVSQAIADGDYGVWAPTAEQQAHLEATHPEGVCDYSLRTVGVNERPSVDTAEVAVTTEMDTPVDIPIEATDPDGDALSYEIVTFPTMGTAEIGNPTLRYTPQPGFVGDDVIEWRASDGVAHSDTVRISITVQTPTTTTTEPAETTTIPVATTTTPAAGPVDDGPTRGRSRSADAHESGRRGYLPRTGAGIAVLVLAGLALVGTGAAAVRTRRRH